MKDVHLFLPEIKLRDGLSYWKVTLTSGKQISEGQRSFDLVRGTRNVDWALDMVGAGDVDKIATLTLCTPKGEATLPILEPYTAFQLKMGTMWMSTGEHVPQAHIIGRVDDRETGACTSVIWDVAEQKIYLDHFTSFRNFATWREGIPNIGAISEPVTGVRLV